MCHFGLSPHLGAPLWSPLSFGFVRVSVWPRRRLASPQNAYIHPPHATALQALPPLPDGGSLAQMLVGFTQLTALDGGNLHRVRHTLVVLDVSDNKLAELPVEVGTATHTGTHRHIHRRTHAHR